jgi:pimeloyl-ACP methyl ester carboxylesterase
VVDGFEEFDIATTGTRIHGRRGGDGPPVLLLHGIPETRLMRHSVAPPLAERFAVVATDLRGYGDSGTPPSAPDHAPYSMREIARDQVEVMRPLGHDRFGVVGHDRGAPLCLPVGARPPGRCHPPRGARHRPHGGHIRPRRHGLRAGVLGLAVPLVGGAGARGADRPGARGPRQPHARLVVGPRCLPARRMSTVARSRPGTSSPRRRPTRRHTGWSTS